MTHGPATLSLAALWQMKYVACPHELEKRLALPEWIAVAGNRLMQREIFQRAAASLWTARFRGKTPRKPGRCLEGYTAFPAMPAVKRTYHQLLVEGLHGQHATYGLAIYQTTLDSYAVGSNKSGIR